MSVSASLVLYQNRYEPVARTICALAGQTLQLRRLLVHVNGASAPPEWLPKLAASVDLPVCMSASSDNLGFARAHNQLLAQIFRTGATHALLINPDVRLSDDALSRLVGCDPNAEALTGPLLQLAIGDELRPEGRIDTAGIRWTLTGRHLDALQGKPLDQAPTTDQLVAGISGACMLVGREAYEALTAATGEFFDEDFIAYREDAELGLRARALGVRMMMTPAARGCHARAQRGTHRGRSRQIDRLGVRNRFLIAFKHGRHRPGWLPFVLLRDLVVVAAVLLKERSSLPGLVEAWRLRGRMRRKGARLYGDGPADASARRRASGPGRV